jgi:hypothetical protein
MQFTKGFVLAVTVTSVGFLLFDISTLYARPNMPNPHKPVPASDVVLVPKISLQGGRAHSGGRRMAHAATGILGMPCEGDKYAVVVGISDYVGTMNDLDYADDDAVLVTYILDKIYRFKRIATLTDGEATHDSILAAIDNVRAAANRDDEVVFFFSGHGMSGIAQDGDTERIDEAIAVNPDPHDGPFASLQPIWDGELRKAFANFPTSRIIFIFDTCMAGGMDDLEEPDRVILMASGERGYAWEGDEWAYGDNPGDGEFTYYLAKGIVEAAAYLYDYSDYGRPVPAQVTIEEAFDYARANCEQDRPLIADDFSGDLLP